MPAKVYQDTGYHNPTGKENAELTRARLTAERERRARFSPATRTVLSIMPTPRGRAALATIKRQKLLPAGALVVDYNDPATIDDVADAAFRDQLTLNLGYGDRDLPKTLPTAEKSMHALPAATIKRGQVVIGDPLTEEMYADGQARAWNTLRPAHATYYGMKRQVALTDNMKLFYATCDKYQVQRNDQLACDILNYAEWNGVPFADVVDRCVRSMPGATVPADDQTTEQTEEQPTVTTETTATVDHRDSIIANQADDILGYEQRITRMMDNHSARERELLDIIDGLKRDIARLSHKMDTMPAPTTTTPTTIAAPMPSPESDAATVARWCHLRGILATVKGNGYSVWTFNPSADLIPELESVGFRYSQKKNGWYHVSPTARTQTAA